MKILICDNEKKMIEEMSEFCNRYQEDMMQNLEVMAVTEFGQAA